MGEWRPKVAEWMSEKRDLKPKSVTGDKKGCYIMIVVLIHQEDVTTLNIHAPIQTPKYSKQILTDLKGEMDNKTIIVGDFKILLPTMDRSSRQKNH